MGSVYFCVFFEFLLLGVSAYSIASDAGNSTENPSSLMNQSFNLTLLSDLLQCPLDRPCDIDQVNQAFSIFLSFIAPDQMAEFLQVRGIKSEGFDPLLIQSLPVLNSDNCSARLNNISITGLNGLNINSIRLSSNVSIMVLTADRFTCSADLVFKYFLVTFRRSVSFQVDKPSVTVKILSANGRYFNQKDVTFDLLLDTTRILY